MPFNIFISGQTSEKGKQHVSQYIWMHAPIMYRQNLSWQFYIVWVLINLVLGYCHGQGTLFGCKELLAINSWFMEDLKILQNQCYDGPKLQTSYLWIWYSSKVVTYWEYVFDNPAITMWILLPNLPEPLLVSTVCTASRRRLPAIVVNSLKRDRIRKLRAIVEINLIKEYRAKERRDCLTKRNEEFTGRKQIVFCSTNK